MTETPETPEAPEAPDALQPLPLPVREVKLLCRLRQWTSDSSLDLDSSTDYLPMTGTVKISTDPQRIRTLEPDGRWSSVTAADRLYNVRADGELVDLQGNVGVMVPDPRDPNCDPLGYILKATVTPKLGPAWSVEIGGKEQLPDVVDLVAYSTTHKPSKELAASLDARIAALEGTLKDAGGLKVPTEITNIDGDAEAEVRWSDSSTSLLALPTVPTSWQGTSLIVGSLPPVDLKGEPGVSVDTIDLDDDGNLVITLTDGTTTSHPLPGGAPATTYSSGKRNIGSLVVAPHGSPDDIEWEYWQLLRVDSMVVLSSSGGNWKRQVTFHTTRLLTVPDGFRPATDIVGFATSGDKTVGTINALTSGGVDYHGIVDGDVVGGFFCLVWPTLDAPPSVLPGIPVI